MANNFNTATNVDLLTQSFLFNLQPPLKRLDRFSQSFSKEAVAFGASITTQITQAAAAASVRSDHNTPYSQNDSGTTDITINLNNDVYYQAYLDMDEITSSPVNLEQRIIRPAAFSIAAKFEALTLANITSGNFANYLPCMSGSFNYNTVTQLGAQASLLNWPQAGRSLFLHPNYVMALRQDSKLTNLFAPQAEEAVIEGFVGRLGGFDIYESPTLSLAGATGGTGYVGFACLPQSICLAARPTRGNDAGMFPGEIKYISSDNDLTIKTTRYYNPDYDQLRIRWSTVFGSAVGDNTALIRITNS
jgi:hypothetical protein